MLLTSSPILGFPDFSKGFLLATDASGVGLGAVLSQVQDDSSIMANCLCESYPPEA